MRTFLCPCEEAKVTNKLLTISMGILATLAILFPQVGIAYADNLDSLTTPTDIGTPDNSVTIQLDKATKTFNITGNGTIDKTKFNNNGDDGPQPEMGYYHDKIMAAIDPENRGNGPLSQYTIHVAGTVHFPNYSDYLFSSIQTKITIDPTISTTNVTNMSWMFKGATNANPDVSKWDTSNVTDMSYMFSETSVTKPDVSKWDTHNVKNMSWMFEGATSANPDVSKWDVSNVDDMSFMFSNAKSANPDVSNWKTSNVENMSGMFEGTIANPDVSKWDTYNVVNMAYMFKNTTNANPDVSKWDTSNVIYMGYMFKDSAKANPDVSKWNTRKLADMAYMFGDSAPIGLDISHFTYRDISDNDNSNGIKAVLSGLNAGQFEHLAVQAGNHTDDNGIWLKVLKTFKLKEPANLVLYHITDYPAYHVNHSNGKTLVTTFFGSTIPDSVLQDMEFGQYYEIKKYSPTPVTGMVKATDTVVGMSVHGAMIADVKDIYGNLVPDGTQLQVYEPGIAKPVIVTVKDGKATIPDFTAPTTVGLNVIKVNTMDGKPVASGTFKTIPSSSTSVMVTSPAELAHTGSSGMLPLVLSVLLSVFGVGMLSLRRYIQGGNN